VNSVLFFIYGYYSVIADTIGVCDVFKDFPVLH
jgi:hypothetical protein